MVAGAHDCAPLLQYHIFTSAGLGIVIFIGIKVQDIGTAQYKHFSVVDQKLVAMAEPESKEAQNGKLLLGSSKAEDEGKLLFVATRPKVSCTNGVKDGTESDVDCGGDCTPCPW